MLSKQKTQNKRKERATQRSRRSSQPQLKKIAKRKNSRNKPKKEEKQKFKNDKPRLLEISNCLKKVFNESNLNLLAKAAKYLLRKAKLTPFIIVYGVSIGLIGNGCSLEALALNMETLFEVDLTGQAFYERMGEKETVNYFKSVFREMVKTQRLSGFDNTMAAMFPRFTGIFIEDSTVISLHKSMKGCFKGSGGSASKSAFKLNLLFNLSSYSHVDVEIFEGTVPDQKIANNVLKHIVKGALYLRDLGYFTIASLKQISLEAYFLTRLSRNVNIYLNEKDKVPVEDLNEFLANLTKKNRSAQMPVYIGKDERLKVNLIVQKVPRWVLNQRKKKYRKDYAKDPSQEFITWARYSIFVTNVPNEMWGIQDPTKTMFDEASSEDNSSTIPADGSSYITRAIIALYAIRWQIELVFKNIKSNIKVKIECRVQKRSLTSKRKREDRARNRALCMIYGKLIAIMLTSIVLSYSVSCTHNGRETSVIKVTNWLINLGRLAKAIRRGTLFKLFTDLHKAFRLLCKDKRKRETTFELVERVLGSIKMAA